MAKRLVLSLALTCSRVISLCLPFLIVFDFASLVFAAAAGGALKRRAFVVNFSLVLLLPLLDSNLS